MRYFFVSFILLSMILNVKAQNLLLQSQWNTPFNAPPFDKIKVEHFMPAIQEGIRIHNDEINLIATNRQPANFSNTIEAIENAGQMLNRVNTIMNVFTSSNTSPELQAIDKQASPLLSEHYDAIYMNDRLFQRVKTVYEKRQSLKLTTEQ